MVPRSVQRLLLAAVLCLLAGATSVAQRNPLTIEDIYHYEGWKRFNGSSAAAMTWVPAGGPWLSDTQYLWPFDSAPGSTPDPAQGRPAEPGAWLQVDAISGASRPLYTFRELERALAALGVAEAEARAASRRTPTTFDEARNAFLVVIENDLYVYNIGTGRASRLTASPGAKTEATFSPDGRSVAFINNHNLFVATIGTIGERALTSDGSDVLLNGTLDWVYSEELYGRGNHRGYWWSPDSSHIAFLQFDERAVPQYILVDDLPYHPTIERWHYPKAGDPNPTVRLGAIDTSSGSLRWVDTSAYSDFLIVNVGWTPDNDVLYQIQDRRQTWLDLNRADRRNGVARRLLRETSDAWVERWQDSSVDPIWLADGSFLWLSERSGWRHFYHYKSDGTLIRQVTRGEWEIRRTHGLDRTGTWALFSSTANSPIGLDLYRVRLDGTDLQRLSTTSGRHQVFVNPSGTLFLDSWSAVMTPPQVRVHRTDSGDLVRVADPNPVPALMGRALSVPEFLQVNTRDGFVMEAMMIRPPTFDPSRKYPVYQFTYAGPHSPQVANAWTGTDFLFHQLLAQRGIIVWICDNRTASGKGMKSAWPLYKNFGELELRDIEDGLAWLKRQPYVDGSRIGIAGTSFGAYMTLYAMTHSSSFRMGIAEGAVTDWRNYDTIYTERYMGLPSENPDGYRKSSPRFDAARLSGQLLLIHSTLDDNVHPQNANQFAYELQRTGTLFRMMNYPKSAHGVNDPQLSVHLRRVMLDFTVQNLLR